MNAPRKSLGQHFLRSAAATSRIIDAVAPRSGQRVLEIGPGEGALTRPLLEAGCVVHSVEIDAALERGLRAALGDFERFHSHRADILKFDLASLGAGRWRVVGNLPYNISSPLLFKLLESSLPIADMHLLLQYEVAARLCAPPGGRRRGRLGVMAGFHAARLERLFNIRPGAFDPPPAVLSTLVRVAMPDERADADLAKRLDAVLRAAFGARRKTLRRCLRPLFGAETEARLHEAGIDPMARAEQLELAQFIAIAEWL